MAPFILGLSSFLAFQVNTQCADVTLLSGSNVEALHVSILDEDEREWSELRALPQCADGDQRLEFVMGEHDAYASIAHLAPGAYHVDFQSRGADREIGHWMLGVGIALVVLAPILGFALFDFDGDAPGLGILVTQIGGSLLGWTAIGLGIGFTALRDVVAFRAAATF